MAGGKAGELYPLSAELQRDLLPDDARKVMQLHEDRGLPADIGRAYLETGDLSKAESRFMLYLRLAPNELEGYDGLGETAFRQGDYEKVLRLFGQSLKLYGDQPKIAARMTEIAKKSDDLAGKAAAALRQAPSAGSGQAPSAGSGQVERT